MHGPTGAPSITPPNERELIRQLQERMTKAEEAITALQSAPARPVAALGFSGVVPVPMPESEIPAAVERIVAACVAVGYDEQRLRLFTPDMHDALAKGVPEAAITAHYAALMEKHGPFDALYQAGVGHGAALRLDESLYGLLLDGTGIGYSVNTATDEEYRAIFGYTLAEIEALEPPGVRIVNVKLFLATNGLQGWLPRAGDSRGHSSDDELFGEPKP